MKFWFIFAMMFGVVTDDADTEAAFGGGSGSGKVSLQDF